MSATLTDGVFLRYWRIFWGTNSAINYLIAKQFHGEKESLHRVLNLSMFS